MNRPLMQIVTTPAQAVGSDALVSAAVSKMVAGRIGAVAVVDGAQLVGIFTERDLMTKVVNAGADMSTLTVAEVMVRDPVSINSDTSRDEATELMVSKHFRHLPVTSATGDLVGMLSIRDLLRHQVNRLQEDVQSLEQYLAADGPGG